MKTFKQFFTEEKEKYLILLPGGYKPPTKGHMHMIESYNKNPAVAKVIVLIGPKEREGFTRAISLELFNLYGISNLKKVTLEDTTFDNPMVASFDFVEKDPRAMEYAGLTFGIGASDKGDDSQRADRLVKYFRANPQKLRPGLQVGLPPIVKALKTNGKEVSATTLRQAIRDTNHSVIKECIPSSVSVADFLDVIYK